MIGVVGDVRHRGLDESPEPMFYTPHTQQPSYHTMTLVVRTTTDVPGLAAAVRATLREMDAGVPLFQVRTVDQVLSRVVAQPRLRAWLLALFAGLAMGLVGAWGASRALGALLFGITPGDAASYAGVAAGLTLAALAATLVPARRAIGVDPAIALRGE